MLGGSSPLDVEGFRKADSGGMTAYQYFWRGGNVVGRTRVGTMGFSGYNHWHFRQFATYRLLSASKKLVVCSHKEGFCIVPTDPVNLLLPHAQWNPASIGVGVGNCGDTKALGVREYMPIGWADTCNQDTPGDAFNITNLPNGTYDIEIIANPEHLLHETTAASDISLRKVIISGARGHRRVAVPAWHGVGREKQKPGLDRERNEGTGGCPSPRRVCAIRARGLPPPWRPWYR